MKKAISVILFILVFLIVTLADVLASNTAFKLEVTAPSEYSANPNINITINVKNINLTDGMSYVSFRLYYDTNNVVPVIKNGFTGDTENRTTFITNCPNFDTWEVIGKLDETRGFYELTFGTEAVSALKTAKNDGDLIFTIPFSIINAWQTSDDLHFYVPDEYVEGGNSDLSEVEVPGLANDVVITKHIDIPSTVSEENNETDDSISNVIVSDDDISQDNISDDIVSEDDVSDESNTEPPINPFELADGATIIIVEGFINGLTDNTTIGQIKNMFKGNVSVGGIGTGATVSAGGETLTIIIKGDVNGDGKIDSKDYLIVKRTYLGTFSLTTIQLKAACLENTTLPTAKDYLKIKRHFLGTYNISY
ncbi:MAG: hypothetical protein A2Y15_06425 [Clostridiales bacterium GWF2_36_10]|nr:MAG: hypothetical protein A2Y15_06425 [Clostridiales bacterium GWF2_36_10]HAN21850.1 hypothetical protein [Clostridiales bacterium]